MITFGAAAALPPAAAAASAIRLPLRSLVTAGEGKAEGAAAGAAATAGGQGNGMGKVQQHKYEGQAKLEIHLPQQLLYRGMVSEGGCCENG